MPNYLEQFNTNVVTFNAKYNLNFNVDAFLQKGREKGWNAAYWHIYSDLASTLADNKLAGENLPSLHDMMSDYEEMVMSPFRMHRLSEGKQVAEVYGGINDQKNRSLMVNNTLETKPVYNYQFMAKKYMNGEYRIRDMVAFAKAETSKQGALSNDTAVEIVKFALALEYANSHRPALWWLFHPFRNNAEKRDSALIKRLVSDKMMIGFDKVHLAAKDDVAISFKKDVSAINYQLKKSDVIDENEVREYDFANEDIKFDTTEIVFDEKEIEKIEINANLLNTEGVYDKAHDKDFVSKDELGKTEKALLFGDVNEEEVIEPLREDLKKQEQPISNLAKIGYRPNPENLKKESAEFKKLRKDVKTGKITSESVIETINLNYNRHVQAYSDNIIHGQHSIQRVLLEREETYQKEDNQLKERFPAIFQQPKENIIDDERININVDLGENNLIDKNKIIESDSVKIDDPSLKK